MVSTSQTDWWQINFLCFRNEQCRLPLISMNFYFTRIIQFEVYSIIRTVFVISLRNCFLDWKNLRIIANIRAHWELQSWLFVWLRCWFIGQLENFCECRCIKCFKMN
jgi:hypothetical protein